MTLWRREGDLLVKTKIVEEGMPFDMIVLQHIGEGFA